jgi:hypothetical protein
MLSPQRRDTDAWILELRLQPANFGIKLLPPPLQVGVFRLECGQLLSRLPGLLGFEEPFFAFEFAAPCMIRRLFVGTQGIPTCDAQMQLPPLLIGCLVHFQSPKHS